MMTKSLFLLIFIVTKITPNVAHAVVDMNGNLVFPVSEYVQAKETEIQWLQEVLRRRQEEENHPWGTEKELNVINPLTAAVEKDENSESVDWWKNILHTRKEMDDKVQRKEKKPVKERHSKREVSPQVFNQHLLHMWMENLSPHNQE